MAARCLGAANPSLYILWNSQPECPICAFYMASNNMFTQPGRLALTSFPLVQWTEQAEHQLRFGCLHSQHTHTSHQQDSSSNPWRAPGPRRMHQSFQAAGSTYSQSTFCSSSPSTLQQGQDDKSDYIKGHFFSPRFPKFTSLPYVFL